MLIVLNVLPAVSAGLWLAGELGLQVRGYLRGGRAEVTEWRSLLVLVAAAVVGSVLSGQAQAHLPQLTLPVGAIPPLVAGLAVAWTGIGLRLWSIHTLGAYFRGTVHVQADHRVVDRGPYRVLRHPSYAGALLGVAGFGLTSGNVAALGALLGCVLGGVLYRIRVEERVLRTELGETYARYADHTARLVPGLW